MGYFTDGYDYFELKKNGVVITGEDKKGVYTVFREIYDVPCNCHPETCCCSGMMMRINDFKVYENGEKIQIN
jgi:hypothetical protein